uniref:GAT domain-containing protein n=1 Tax=Heterorhabditis bacteriophora TaxID=37862 RepID=A0A1I7XKN9_HETBA
MNAQGRRMDEQRATLLPGLNSGGQAQEILEKLNGGSTRSELEGANAIDEHLIELLIRVQSQRMNEQRSELAERQTENTETEQTQPVTIPEDDISALVMRMQAGRLEEQRAHLQPQESG